MTSASVSVSASGLVELVAGEFGSTLSPFGARLCALRCPDRSGRSESVVLPPPSTLDGGVDPSGKVGATCGRWANRLARGRLRIGTHEYGLSANWVGPSGEAHTLHGGADGFDRRWWRVLGTGTGSAEVSRSWSEGSSGLGGVRRSGGVEGGSNATAHVVFGLDSPDGDQGFPGAMEVTATYTLAADGTLTIGYEAVADRPTAVNLTNHAYWNLGPGPDLGDHLLRVDAEAVLEVDEDLIPTGRVLPVDGTPWDLTTPTLLAERLADPRLAATGGFDHCLVLGSAGRGAPSGRGSSGTALTLRAPDAELVHPPSGRRLRWWTDQPSVQVFTDNGRGHRAVCLESQRFPDAPGRRFVDPAGVEVPAPWVLVPSHHSHGQSYVSTTVAQLTNDG